MNLLGENLYNHDLIILQSLGKIRSPEKNIARSSSLAALMNQSMSKDDEDTTVRLLVVLVSFYVVFTHRLNTLVCGC